MRVLNKRFGRRTLGIWIALAAMLLLMLGWGMQAYSVLNWDGAVDMGLQNERFGAEPVQAALAKESWGVAIADLLWALPITLLAIAGLVRRRFYGFVAGMMACAIGVYFPLVFAAQRWSTHRETAALALCLWLVPCSLAIVGLWANRHEFAAQLIKVRQ